jgi:hypothetical protein
MARTYRRPCIISPIRGDQLMTNIELHGRQVIPPVRELLG